jgi:hypothetical protein
MAARRPPSFGTSPTQQGNIRDVITSAGSVADRIRLDAFGNIISRTAPALDQRHFFIGREWDANAESLPAPCPLL